VDSENREGARLATAYLIGLGHRRIATITGPLHRAVALDRRDGYKQALLEGGLPIVPELQAEADFSTTGGYAAMAQLLARHPRPTAVFVAGDAMVPGALSAVREARLRVPDDLSIVGFDDLPLAASAAPPLTTIRQPIHALGTRAVELLLAQFGGQQQAVQHPCLPVELVVRESCAPPATT
jgi:LacI family transcriptional regulator